MMNTIKLAVVLPCYNEEDILRDSAKQMTILYNRMIAEKLITDKSLIVFVNDGSTDKTWQIIRELHQENAIIRGVNLTNNVGHQHAIMAGMMIAKKWSDAIITIDADLQDDIECIPKMIKEMQAGYDIVYGIKKSRNADPLIKRLSAHAFYKLQLKMGIKAIFNHADFRLMSHRALDVLENYEERNLYLRGIIPMLGLPSTTVDDVISKRKAGASKYTFNKMLSLALDGITSFSVKPLYCIIYLGIIFLLISLCIGIHTLYVYILGKTVAGWTSLILSIWMVGGFILIALGITCIYIGKIFNEVKHRPLYNVYEIL